MDIPVDTPVDAAVPRAAWSPERVAAAALAFAGGVVALAGGVLAAVLALILVPLRLDTGVWVVRLPVAVVLAIAGNALLLWFAREAIGARWGVLVPSVGWFAVMLPALGSTTEGARLLMPNDWVGTLTLFCGTIVLTIGTVLALLARPARIAPTVYDGRS